jgi:hypothetical protein
MLSVIECLLHKENSAGERSQQALVAGGNDEPAGNWCPNF